MPSASVCAAFATSATSATGAAGTPASASRCCQASVSSVDEPPGEQSHRARPGARPASGFVRKRGSSTSSGRPSTVADRSEQPVVPACDHQLAVARREHLVRRHHRESRALAVRDGAVREVAGEVVADVSERRLVERDVDHGSLARPVALEQRREHAERRPRAGSLVDQRRADPNARPAGLAGDRDQPTRGLHQRVVPRLVAERARRARRRRRSSRRAAGCARAAPRRRARARPPALGGGSGGTRRRRRRAAATPRAREDRAARSRASACRRWRRGTSSPRRSRTAAPRPGRRRPCPAAPP